jgi:hypothetical protein
MLIGIVLLNGCVTTKYVRREESHRETREVLEKEETTDKIITEYEPVDYQTSKINFYFEILNTVNIEERVVYDMYLCTASRNCTARVLYVVGSVLTIGLLPSIDYGCFGGRFWEESVCRLPVELSREKNGSDYGEWSFIEKKKLQGKRLPLILI